MTAGSDRAGWTVIIPVKPTAIGKSRLEGPATGRISLARAIALDTIAAAVACREVATVVVVTDDVSLTVAVSGLTGVRVLPEKGIRGIDAAVAVGAALVGTHSPRVALLGDLPALDPLELETALRTARTMRRGAVADAEGTGTTMVTAAAGLPWQTAFGPGSFARHRALGCEPIELPANSTLRRDVDTMAQFADAERLGLGPASLAQVELIPADLA